MGFPLCITLMPSLPQRFSRSRALTFLQAYRLMRFMRTALCLFVLLVASFLPSAGAAIETAPPLSDREIVERLTRLEEGLNALRTSHEALRADMNTQFDRIDTQFDRLANLMLGIVAAFAGIVAVTISLAIWDRRTVVRPVERQLKQVEEEVAGNRQRFHALLEALRALSQRDPQVEQVLKDFNLL